MDRKVENFRSSKTAKHESDSLSTGNSVHHSQLSWIAHWRRAGEDHMGGLMHKKQLIESDGLRDVHHSFQKIQSRENFGDAHTHRPALSNSNLDIPKARNRVVVAPSLLRPGGAVGTSSNQVRDRDRFFELVTKSSKVVPYSSPDLVDRASHSFQFDGPSVKYSRSDVDVNINGISRQNRGTEYNRTGSSLSKKEDCHYQSFSFMGLDGKANTMDINNNHRATKPLGRNDGSPHKHLHPLVVACKNMPGTSRLAGASNSNENFPSPSVHDVETLRICATVDKMEEVPGGPSKFSKTTHHFLFTKKCGMRLGTGDELPNKSTCESEVKQCSIHETVDAYQSPCYSNARERSPNAESPCRDGVLPSDTIQNMNKRFLGHSEEEHAPIEVGVAPQSTPPSPRGICTQSAFPLQLGKLHSDDAQIEYCAETDDLDLNIALPRSSSSGQFSHCSNKMQESVPTHSQPREAPLGVTIEPKIPGIGGHTPSLAGVTGSVNMEIDTSRTQTLDGDQVLLHFNQPGSSGSDQPYVCQPFSKEDSRWVKRLKCSATEAYGSRLSEAADVTSREERFRLSNKVANNGRVVSVSESRRSATTPNKDHHLDEAIPKTAQSIEKIDPIWSSPWIRRLNSKKLSDIQNGSAAVLRASDSFDLPPNESSGERLASIAAMALMGKTITNFKSCHSIKRGSLVLWKAQGL